VESALTACGRRERVVRHFNCLAHGGALFADAVAPQKDTRRLNERGLVDYGGVNCLRVFYGLACRDFNGTNFSKRLAFFNVWGLVLIALSFVGLCVVLFAVCGVAHLHTCLISLFVITL
jgi:hypothetical protein